MDKRRQYAANKKMPTALRTNELKPRMDWRDGGKLHTKAGGEVSDMNEHRKLLEVTHL